jgi:hypothetical protein
MKRHFSAPTPRFGRTNSRLTLGYQQRSPYYWWWAFLRRNTDYLACCTAGGKGALAGLHEDFGDVLNDNFHSWWTTQERGVRLFAEQPLTVKFGELEMAAEWQPHWDKQDVMVIAVPLTVSKRTLKGAFARLLEQRHTGHKSGRPALAAMKEVSTAKYKMERNYTIRSLQTTLAVYDLWLLNQQRSGKDKLTLWEIGRESKINSTAIKDAVSDSTHDRLVGRNVLGATVSRYVKQAKAIIANTAQGKFPLL